MHSTSTADLRHPLRNNDQPRRATIRHIPLFTASPLLLSLALPVAAQNLLEEVIVSSSRVPMALRDVGTSVSVIGQAEIEQRGFLSLPELLRSQTAVAATNNGGAGKATTLRIRGEEGFRTLVLLDGIEISDPSSPQVSARVEQLLSSGVERIEILRGPQGLGYGADAGGVVSITTARPDDGLGGGIAAESGRYGTRQLSGQLGGDFGALDVMIGVAGFKTDGFNARDTDSGLRDDDGYKNSTVHASAGWDVSDALRVDAVIRRIDGENQFDACFNASFSPTDDCDDNFEQDNWRLAASYQHAGFSHELAYADTQTSRDFLAEGTGFFAAEGGLERLSYLGSWRASRALQLIFGADHETESIDDGSFDRERDQSGVFAEYQGHLSAALTVTAGARYDDNDDFGSNTSYRISAAWVTMLGDDTLKLKSSYGTGFRAPSLYEISYNRGPFAFPPAAGTSLEQETSRGYDLGIALASDSGRYLELTWFDQRVDDVIDFDLVGFSGYLQSAGESRSQGIELTAFVPLAAGFSFAGNYTYNETETPGGAQRAFRPEHLANIGTNFLGLDDRLRVGANLRYSASAVDTSGAAVDDYTVADLNVSYRFADALTVYARLENAFDREYQEIPTYNTARQSAYAGIRYEF